MAILKPEGRVLSPTIGLLAMNSSVFSTNLLACPAASGHGWGIGDSCSLAKELFFAPYAGAPVRATRSQSKAASYLSTTLMGHMVGLALSNASNDEVEDILRKAGVQSNRINGEWTGVSFVRFKRLVKTLHGAFSDSAVTPAVMMMMQLVWEKSEEKRCLLNFLLAVDSHHPVIADKYRNLHEEGPMRDQWLSSSFDESDITDTAVVNAAQAVLRTDCEDTFADSMEIVAASMSQVHAFKPAIPLNKHGYKGEKAVPDCVEMVVREIFDLLLFDPVTMRFDLERLPSTSSRQLVTFYEAVGAGAMDEADQSREWYWRCQELPGCDYLAATGDGRPYELKPGMANIGRVAGLLLGVEIGSMRELQSFWNDSGSGSGPAAAEAEESKPMLLLEERQAVHRSMLNDEANRREIAVLRLRDSHHSIEFTLDPVQEMCICTHHRRDFDWIDSIRSEHLDFWARRHFGDGDAEAEGAVRDVQPPCTDAEARYQPLMALWPLLLGTSMLQRLISLSTSKENFRCSSLPLLQAILASPWGNEKLRIWSPLNDASNESNVLTSAIDKATAEAGERALRTLAILVTHAQQERSAADIVLGRELLPMLLEHMPDEMDTVQLAIALHNASILHSDSMRVVLDARRDANALQCMLEFGQQQSLAALVRLCGRLSSVDAFLMLNFALHVRLGCLAFSSG